MCNASPQRNNQIKLPYYDETKKGALGVFAWLLVIVNGQKILNFRLPPPGSHKSALLRSTGPAFSCLTKLSMESILLTNVKMPKIVGILTFYKQDNTASESVKAKGSLCFIFLPQ